MYEIGARIKRLREERKISQKELAERIGISNSRVSNWEQGLNRPDVDLLAGICTALSVSPSELLDIKPSVDDFDEKERSMIKDYRALDERGKDIVDMVIQSQLQYQSVTPGRPSPEDIAEAEGVLSDVLAQYEKLL